MKSHFFRSLFMIALAHLTIELCANFLPVIYPLLISAWDLTYTQIGLVALILGSSGSLAQLLFGYLSDRWNTPYLTVLSVAWMGLVMGLVGLSPSYPVLLVLVALGALASAAFHPAGAILASASGGSRRGAAVSIFSVGGNLGSALSPLLVAAGIAWLGLPGTVVLIPVALLVSLGMVLQLRRAGSQTRPAFAHSGRVAGQDRLLSNPTALASLAMIILVVMCRSWVQVALMTYLPEWLQSQGHSLAVGGQMLALLMVAVGFGSLTGGSLSDWLGRWQVLALSMLLLGPALWFFLQAGGVMQAVLVGVLGVLIGLSFPVGVVMAQETWPQGVGFASALVMGLGWAPGGLGASFTGLMADNFSLGFGLQLLVAPPLLALAAALAFAALQGRAARPIQSDLA